MQEPPPSAPRTDRAFATALIASAVAVAGGVLVVERVTSHDAAARRARAAEEALRPSSLAPMRGHWVWTRELEAGRVRREVGAEDLVPRVGPDGWPGCPPGIVCTRYGSRRWVVGPRDRAHYFSNVFTSSDYQYEGRLEWVAPGLARLWLERHYSCAHPRVRYALAEARWVRFRRAGDELHLGVESWTEFGAPFPTARPRAEPARWLVMRRVTRAAFYGPLMLRRCQPEPGFDCDAACFSEALGL